MQDAVLEGGFSEAPVEAARAFRAALEAMARPGRIETVVGAAPPAPASSAAGALLLTLCDPETPLHLAGRWDGPALRDWVRFHCGAPLVGPAEARFALGDWAALSPLSPYAVGTMEYPDRSATLIVELPALEPRGVTLRGPGIRESAALSLPETEAFRDNATRFPLGLDFFFTCGDRLAALPRSTRIG